jgi:predicted Zn-dependent protease
MLSSSQQPSGLDFILVEARKQAHAMYKLQRWTEVEVLAKGILCAEPDDAWTLSLYASMWRKRGQYRKALALMDRAHALDPSDENITSMLVELKRFFAGVARTTNAARS